MRQIYPGGLKRTGLERLYSSWKHMLRRCENPQDDGYRNYGARGVRVCEEWREFRPFADWALANGWVPGLTIDREDNDGNYEPGNCRWASRKSQNQNMRKSFRLSNGDPAVEAARENGVPLDTYRWRMRQGWPPELAVSAPRCTRLKSALAGKVCLKPAGLDQ